MKFAISSSVPPAGKRLDGLWHTAVVAYGEEYYFGGGIQKAAPGSTPAGAPTTVVSNGTTEVPKWMFEQYLDGIRDRCGGVNAEPPWKKAKGRRVHECPCSPFATHAGTPPKPTTS